MEGTARRTIIGVMGGADPDLSPEVLEAAERVGRGIARAGAVLLCGGRSGVMEAAARGAKSVPRGETLAVLPGPDPDRANPFMDWVVATGMGNGRNVINILSSDAVIALPGGAGTLSEAALALKCGIHVVSLGSWDLAATAPEEGRALVKSLFHPARTPEEAVVKALRHARRRPPTPDEDRRRIRRFLEGWVERRTSPSRRGQGRDPWDHEEGRAFHSMPAEPDDAAIHADQEGVPETGLRFLPETLEVIPLPGRVFQALFRAQARREEPGANRFACNLVLKEGGRGLYVVSKQILPIKA